MAELLGLACEDEPPPAPLLHMRSKYSSTDLFTAEGQADRVEILKKLHACAVVLSIKDSSSAVFTLMAATPMRMKRA